MENEKQINIFIDGVRDYFEKIGHSVDDTQVGAPYLIKNDQECGLDYTGMIAVGGDAKGAVFFTANKVMLKYLLLRQYESNFDEAYMRDMAGEVANTIAGNARRHLGAGFHISPPKILDTKISRKYLSKSSRSYIIPIKWNNNTSQLIVSISYKN